MKDLKVDNRLQELKLSMFTSTHLQFPQLKSKAAETRNLAEPSLRAFTKLMNPDDAQHKQVQLLLKLAVRLEKILSENKENYKLDEAAAADWQRTCQGFVQVNTQLGHFYHPRRIMLFHMTIKYHYMLHLALLGHRINPRLAWCYSGEKMMQVAKMIVQSSHLGSPAALVVNKVMTKYSRGLSLHCLADKWRR